MINRALAADLPPDAAWDVTLHMPPWVPPSEVAQVEARLAGWVASLRRPALQPLLEQLRQAMRAPLRPFWVCPESGSSYTPPEAPASTPAAAYLSVVTLCASRVSRHEAKKSATHLPPALCSVQPRVRWLHWLCAAPSPPPLPHRFPVWPRFRWGRRGQGMRACEPGFAHVLLVRAPRAVGMPSGSGSNTAGTTCKVCDAST